MDVGKQFAEYLLRGKMVVANRMPQVTHFQPNKEDFIFIMQSWFDILCSCNQVESIKECATTAIDVFAEWKRDIAYYTAKHLATSQFYEDAIDFFRMALDCNDCEAIEPSNYDITEDLEQIFNRCIPRWHFRMINDVSRNRSFFYAIKKAVADGHSNVVDIGCGSGILSLFAAANGARNIMAFEVSRLMCNVAALAFSAYSSESHICLLNIMSTDHVAQSKHPRPDVAVMEIFDCGLFGEGVLPTLKHVLKQLMGLQAIKKSTNSLIPKVIPKSARLFATLIECSEIRKHSRSRASVLDFHMNSLALLGKMDPEDSSEQPYTTENLNNIKGGYQCLSEPVKMLEISFDSIKELDKLSEQKFFVDIPVCHGGQLDAIVTWFELQLDDDIMLSSSPQSKSCWEQAVYHVHHGDFSTDISHLNIIKGSSVQLQCYCNDHYLQIVTHCIHAPFCKMLESQQEMKSDMQTGFPEFLREKENFLQETNIGCLERCNTSSISSFNGSTSRIEVLPPSAETEVASDRTERRDKMCTNVENIQRKKLEWHLAAEGHSYNSCEITPKSNAINNLSGAYESLYEPNNSRSGDKTCSCGGQELSCTTKGPLKRTVIPANRRKIARINDEIYCGQYFKAISQTIAEVLKWKDHLDVLFLCEGISLLPLLVTHRDIISIDVAVGSSENHVFIQHVAAENRIDLRNFRFLHQSLPDVVSNGKKYDVIVNEVIEENGMLCQTLFNDLVLIRTFLLKMNGKLIPESLTMIGRIVESSTLENDSFVQDPSVALGFDIGRFLNQYQVSTQPDVSMLNLPHKCLTDDFVLLPIELLEGSTDEEILKVKLPRTAKLSLKVNESGQLSAVGYWFTIHLADGIVLSTEADSKTHWNQSFVVLKQREIVNVGSSLVLNIVLNRGNLHVVDCSVTDE